MPAAATKSEGWLKAQGGRVKARRLNVPTLVGMQGNRGLS
jgi:sulfur-oxidizing protein SoxB